MKAGFNTMRQNIHKLSNTTIMSPTDTWKLSDANIKPQTGMQVAAGLYLLSHATAAERPDDRHSREQGGLVRRRFR